MEEALEILKRAGAVTTDEHFVYTTGKHGSAYINTDLLFPSMATINHLAARMVEPFLGEVDCIAAPAIGGIVLAVSCASALTTSNPNVQSVWADKDGPGFRFERAGFENHVREARVLVVEDMLNTGGSVDKVCRLVEQAKGTLVGVSVIVNRGPSTAATLGVPRLEALSRVDMQAFEPESCPFCAEGKPIITDVGHGAEFREAHPEYSGGYRALTS